MKSNLFYDPHHGDFFHFDFIGGVVTQNESDLAFVRANIPCQAACPAQTNVPAYILAIYERRYNDAYQINRETNILPGILGRVCTRPCQKACRHAETDLGQSVSICHLKRAAADLRSRNVAEKFHKLPKSGKKIAIVGAGPAGLAAAQTLILLGHQIILFEAMPKAGGMLRYGIPSFRLPEEIVDEEVANIAGLGVAIECNAKVGKKVSIFELRQAHDALLVTTGCPLAKKVGIGGEGLGGFFPGLDFLVRVNRGETPTVGRRAVVFGGGFTAVDCARTVRRLGAEDVSLCIRRNVEDLPVSAEEIEEAKQEGIKILNLVSPCEVKGKGNRVEGVAFRKNKLIAKPGQKREVPTMIEGTDFFVEADTVIGAIGQVADTSILADGKDFAQEFNPTGSSKISGLFAAGDCVRGASTIIEAIGHAKEVALSIDTFLMGRVRSGKKVWVQKSTNTHRERGWDFLKPSAVAQEESKRCYQCNLKYEIDVERCIYCRRCIEVCPRNCIALAKRLEMDEVNKKFNIVPATKWNEVAGIVIQNDRCIRCGECVRVCPTECIHVLNIQLVQRWT